MPFLLVQREQDAVYYQHFITADPGHQRNHKDLKGKKASLRFGVFDIRGHLMPAIFMQQDRAEDVDNYLGGRVGIFRAHDATVAWR